MSSKALVIKGVNFSTNRIKTVSFGEEVPCTAVSLSQSSITFTALGTYTLTATPTPSNTTDSVVWSTSDSSVATVDSGVVTAVGIGTATITATCGTQTATCSVSVSVTLSNSDFAMIDHKVNSGTDLNNGKDYLSAYGDSSDTYKKYEMALSATATTSGYKACTGTNELYDAKYPIMIPNNATVIEAEVPNGTTLSSTTVIYFKSSEQPSYSISGKGTKVVYKGNAVNASQNKCTHTIPDNVSGLDSFAIVFTFSGAVDALPTGTTIKFKTSA